MRTVAWNGLALSLTAVSASVVQLSHLPWEAVVAAIALVGTVASYMVRVTIRTTIDSRLTEFEGKLLKTIGDRFVAERDCRSIHEDLLRVIERTDANQKDLLRRVDRLEQEYSRQD